MGSQPNYKSHTQQQAESKVNKMQIEGIIVVNKRANSHVARLQWLEAEATDQLLELLTCSNHMLRSLIWLICSTI